MVRVFPQLLDYIKQSEDMVLLLQGTITLKTFIHLAAEQILKVTTPDAIIVVAKKLLDPKTNE